MCFTNPAQLIANAFRLINKLRASACRVDGDMCALARNPKTDLFLVSDSQGVQERTQQIFRPIRQRQPCVSLHHSKTIAKRRDLPPSNDTIYSLTRIIHFGRFFPLPES